MNESFTCRIADEASLDRRWDNLIEANPDERENWIIWKEQNLQRFRNGSIIPYYGYLDDQIICEATAMLDPAVVQNAPGLVDQTTAYLSAFRTDPNYQNQGYFSRLFSFMMEDLQNRGYTKVTLGVEPHHSLNRARYQHYGFTEFLKSGTEYDPDGSAAAVDYYQKTL